MLNDRDFIIVEGYKKSNLKKIEVFRRGISKNIITPKERLICIAADTDIETYEDYLIDINDYKNIVNVILDKFKKETEGGI